MVLFYVLRILHVRHNNDQPIFFAIQTQTGSEIMMRDTLHLIISTNTVV